MEAAPTQARGEEVKISFTRLSADAASSHSSERLVGLRVISEQLEGHGELEKRKEVETSEGDPVR